MLILQLSSKHRAIFKPRAQIYLSSEMLEEIQITLILRPSSSFQFKEYKPRQHRLFGERWRAQYGPRLRSLSKEVLGGSFVNRRRERHLR